MATVKLEGFIHQDRYSGALVFYHSDMSKYGDVLVAPHTLEFEFELPEGWNPAAARVAALNKEKQALVDEFNRRVAQINDQISSLQALTFDAEVMA